MDKEFHSGEPPTNKSDENITHDHDILNINRRISVQMIAEILSTPKTIVSDIVNDILN